MRLRLLLYPPVRLFTPLLKHFAMFFLRLCAFLTMDPKKTSEKVSSQKKKMSHELKRETMGKNEQSRTNP